MDCEVNFQDDHDHNDDMSCMMRNIDYESGLSKVIVPAQDPDALKLVESNDVDDDDDEALFEEDDKTKQDSKSSSRRLMKRFKHADRDDFHVLSTVVKHVAHLSRSNSANSTFCTSGDGECGLRTSDSKTYLFSPFALSGKNDKDKDINRGGGEGGGGECKISYNSILRSPWEREARSAMLGTKTVSQTNQSVSSKDNSSSNISSSYPLKQTDTCGSESCVRSKLHAASSASNGGDSSESSNTSDIFDILSRCGIPTSPFVNSINASNAIINVNNKNNTRSSYNSSISNNCCKYIDSNRRDSSKSNSNSSSISSKATVVKLERRVPFSQNPLLLSRPSYVNNSNVNSSSNVNYNSCSSTSQTSLNPQSMDMKDDKADAIKEEEDEEVKSGKEALYSNFDKLFNKNINYAKVRQESTRQKAEHIKQTLGDSGRSHHQSVVEVLKNTITKQKAERAETSRARRNEEIITSNLSHATLMVKEHRWFLYPELRPVELKNFHRPRWFSSFLTQPRPIKDSKFVSTHSVGKIAVEKRKLLVPLPIVSDAASTPVANSNDFSTTTTSAAAEVNQLVSSQMHDIDVKSLSVLDGDFVIIEYVEENPPMIQNFGMVSKILNYHRRVMSVNTNDSSSSRQDDKTTNESIGLIYSSILPPHVKALYKQKNNQSLYVLDNTIPRLPIGDTIVLEPEDDSPFVGNVEEADHIVPTLVNRMFKTPIFNHTPNPNIFLLILDAATAKKKSGADGTAAAATVAGKDETVTADANSSNINKNSTSNKSSSDFIATGNVHSTCYSSSAGGDSSAVDANNEYSMNTSNNNNCNYSNNKYSNLDTLVDYQNFKLRKIPISFLAGQLEPALVVPSPAQMPSDAQIHFCNLVLLREFYQIRTGQAIEKYRNGVTIDDVRSWIGPDRLNSKISDDMLNSLITERTGGHGGYATYNQVTRLYRPIDDFRFDENEHINAFKPEDICLYQSSLYSEYRLKKSNIYKDVDIEKLLEQLLKVKEYQKSFELGAAGFLLNKETTRINHPSEYSKLEGKYPRLDAVLRFQSKKIHRLRLILDFLVCKLAVAAWNISNSFSKCVLDTESKLQMSIKGHGDPSGVGEAICYIPRVVTKESSKKKIAVAGTDNDLRVLSNEEQFDILCNNFSEKLEKMKKLSRWDRITFIKYLCSISEDKDINSRIIRQFSRLSGLFGKEMNDAAYMKTCRTVWKKQREALMLSYGYLSNPPVNPSSKQSFASIDAIMESNIKAQIRAIQDRPCLNEPQEIKRKRRQREAKSAPNFTIIKVITNQDENDDVLSFFGIPVSEVAKYTLLSISTSQDSRICGSSSITEDSMSATLKSKAVKIIRHVLTDDNKVKVVVKFSTDPRDIERTRIEVQRKQSAVSSSTTLRVRSAAARDQSHLLDSASIIVDSVSANPRLNLSLKIRGGLGNISGGYGIGASYNDPSMHGSSSSSSINLSAGGMKLFVSTAQLNKLDIASEEALAVANAAKRRGVLPPYYARLPKVGLASELEDVLLLLYNNKNSFIFRSPVSPDLRDYYEMVKEPICLLDMLHKIHAFVYSTISEFIDDLNKMVDNCCIFNGAQSDFSKTAKSLRDLAARQLNYNVFDMKSKRNLPVGLGNDSKIHLLQEAITSKDNEFRVRARRLETSKSAQSARDVAVAVGLEAGVCSIMRVPSDYDLAEEEGDLF